MNQKKEIVPNSRKLLFVEFHREIIYRDFIFLVRGCREYKMRPNIKKFCLRLPRIDRTAKVPEIFLEMKNNDILSTLVFTVINIT